MIGAHSILMCHHVSLLHIDSTYSYYIVIIHIHIVIIFRQCIYRYLMYHHVSLLHIDSTYSYYDGYTQCVNALSYRSVYLYTGHTRINIPSHRVQCQ